MAFYAEIIRCFFKSLKQRLRIIRDRARKCLCSDSTLSLFNLPQEALKIRPLFRRADFDFGKGR